MKISRTRPLFPYQQAAKTRKWQHGLITTARGGFTRVRGS
jgi:hypothetical protein